ncbi:MAG: calcium/sodium antiporter, partial [Sedimenticolaceae bacterium]
TLKREYPMLLAVCLITLLLMLDGALSRIDGGILLIGLATIIYGMVRIAVRDRNSDPLESEFKTEMPETMPTRKALLNLFLGLIVLLVSSKLLTWGAVNIATTFGISDLVIGLTIIALGTSLPELAASIISALKNEHDIAIGNIIGSNMYNLLAVLAVPGLIAPGSFDPLALTRDMPVMIALTLAMYIMGYGFKGPGRINRFEGTLLLLAFIGYQTALFLNSQDKTTPEPTAQYTISNDPHV